jgi:nucleotide-binding universal stress UspA family protein
MSTGPVIIGYDGSAASERALRSAANLLAPHKAVVVVVWEAGRGFDVVEIPSLALELPPATVDLRAGYELEEAMAEAAERLARRGAALAVELGLDAEGLAVADEMTVAETLVRVADERGAGAIAIGSHGHGALREAFLGSTSRGVMRHATCPVLLVRAPDGAHS